MKSSRKEEIEAYAETHRENANAFIVRVTNKTMGCDE